MSYQQRLRRQIALGVVATAIAACGGSSMSPASDQPPPASSTPSPIAPSTASPDPTAATDRELVLVWGDEFDEPAGTPPNPDHWGYGHGDGTAESIAGWGNNELEYYTELAENAATDGAGNLVITARVADPGLDCYYGPCKYTSARLLTSGKYVLQYGRVEARIKVPSGVGLWPAFWMLGTNIGSVGWPASGEIDVMENVGRQPKKLYGTLHGPG